MLEICLLSHSASTNHKQTSRQKLIGDQLAVFLARIHIRLEGKIPKVYFASCEYGQEARL